MVILEPIPFIVFAAVVYVLWALLKKPQRAVSYWGRLILLAGCVILASYYFLPFPLGREAMEALLDPRLPLNEAIKINPAAQIMEDIRHLEYYFANLFPIFGAAALIGFSVDLTGSKTFPVKKHLLISFLIPCTLFIFHAVFKLITGYMWKIADTGQILWFMLFYFLGYLVSLLAEKIRSGITARNDD